MKVNLNPTKGVIYAFLTAVLFIFGCGYDKENVPPQVVEVTPENNSSDQEINSSITAVFSEQIDPSSLSNSNFIVSVSGIEIDGELTYEPETLKATFTPAFDLPLNAPIIVTITEKVRDLAGNSLSPNYRWTFSTRDGIWHDETILDSNAWWSTQPKVTSTIDGGAVATWPHYDGTTHIVYASRYSPQSGWEKGVALNAGAGDAYDIQITTGPSGGTALIARQGSGSSRIYTNWFDVEAGLWSNGVPLDDGSLVANSNPQIAIAPNGDAIAVWEKANGFPSPNIYGSHYEADMDFWSNEILLEAGYWGARNPRIAISPSGNAISVWQQSEKVGNVFIENILANRYAANSGQWGTEEFLEFTDNKANYPDVAVDADGNAIVVWRQHDGSTNPNIYHLYANYFDCKTNLWSGPTLLQSGNVNVGSPRVYFDRNGSATVVWMDYSLNKSIYAIRYDSETRSWDALTLLATGDAETRSPRFSYDYQGNGFAVWYQRIGTEFHVFASRYSAITKQWSEKIALSVTEGYSPDISLDQSGHATIVWSYGNGSTGTIYARRFE